MKLIRLDSHQCKYLLRRDLKQVRDSADFADCSTDLENWQQTVCFLGCFFLVCTLVFGMTRRPLPKELSVQVGWCGNDGLEMEQKHKQLWKSSVKSENQSVFFIHNTTKTVFQPLKKIKD